MVRQAARKSEDNNDDKTSVPSLTVEPGSGGGGSSSARAARDRDRADTGGRTLSNHNSNAPSSASASATLTTTVSSALRSRIPESLDVFGFSISPRQFVLVQIAATFMLGLNGSKLRAEFAAYHNLVLYLCVRLTSFFRITFPPMLSLLI
jgi:hypothetical protein